MNSAGASALLIFFVAVAPGASGAVGGPAEPKWSEGSGGLAVRLSAAPVRCRGDAELTAKLFIRAVPEGEPRARLLAGGLVFTFVPTGSAPGIPPVIAHRPFSGGGGIDYSGRMPLAYKIAAPSRPGSYNLIATVVSTRAEIDNHLMTSRMMTREPYWTGTASTPAVPVKVTGLGPWQLTFDYSEVPPNPGAGAPRIEIAFRCQQSGEFAAHKVVKALSGEIKENVFAEAKLSTAEVARLEGWLLAADLPGVHPPHIDLPGGSGIEDGWGGTITLTTSREQHVVRFTSRGAASVARAGQINRVSELVYQLKRFAPRRAVEAK